LSHSLATTTLTLTVESGQSSPVSQGSREARGRLTAVHLVERVLPQFFGSALQVTPHFHLLVFDGVFMPQEGSVRFEPLPPPTFDFDMFACVRCGGRRRVLVYLKGARGVRAILEHLGLPTACASLAPARGPSQAVWC
jgi:LSD1 subclass zinc finger protein